MVTRGRPGSEPSKRELEVLVAYCEGEGAKGAARRLGLAEQTIRNHLANVRFKLGVATTTAAVYALRAKLD